MKELLKKMYMLPSSLMNLISFAFHRVTLGKNVVVNGRLRLFGKGKLIIGDNVRINSLYRMNPIGGNEFSSIYIKPSAVVKIGNLTGLSNAAIYASTCVDIGQRVKIGGNVKIYDTDFHSIDYLQRAMENDPGVKTEAVRIADDVFIGANSIILKGVSIGARSVIGAGSVVTKSIPDDEVWGGAPAHFIKKLGGVINAERYVSSYCYAAA